MTLTLNIQIDRVLLFAGAAGTPCCQGVVVWGLETGDVSGWGRFNHRLQAASPWGSVAGGFVWRWMGLDISKLEGGRL